MEIAAGTSGYSYKEWCGPFYPEKLPAAAMLAHYATRLPAVEINNTFYRLPKESLLEAWASQVPESFRFAIKASRKITHIRRLKGAEDETAYLLRATAMLGEKLGAILFQLPPNLPCDLELFDAFLALLPEGTPAAFEFRHPSWIDEPVVTRLRAREFPLVAVDDEERESPEILSTSTWGYLRLRRPGYETAALAAWAERITTQPWRRAFVFFKHEDAGEGPKLASELLRLAAEGAKRAPANEAPLEKKSMRRPQAR